MLAQLPKLYETEGATLDEKVIYLNFFLGGGDWYAAENCTSDRVFFRYAILNNDLQNSEWGYISLDELRSLRTTKELRLIETYTESLGKDL